MRVELNFDILDKVTKNSRFNAGFNYEKISFNHRDQNIF